MEVCKVASVEPTSDTTSSLISNKVIRLVPWGFSSKGTNNNLQAGNRDDAIVEEVKLSKQVLFTWRVWVYDEVGICQAVYRKWSTISTTNKAYLKETQYGGRHDIVQLASHQKSTKA
jgi:hypothetical protein